MAELGAFTTKSDGDTITAALWNSTLTQIRTWATTYALITDVARTVTADLTFSGNPTFSGTPVFSAGSTHSSGLTVSTGTTAVQALTCTTLATSSNGTVGGTLGVTGATTLNSTLAVTGAITASSTINGQTISASASLTGTLAVTGATTLQSTLAVTGAITASSTINSQTISASASLTGTLTVATGLTISAGGAAITGNSAVTGTLSVSTTMTVGTKVTLNSGADQLVVGAVSASVGSIYGTDTGAIVYAADAHRFFSKNAGTEWWQITSSGHLVAQTDNSYDIGANGATRPRNLFLAGYLRTGASTASAAPANIGQGTAPSSPTDGDIWVTSAGMFCRANSTTVGPFSSSGTAVVPTCRAYRASAATVANNTAVPLDGEDFDTATMHSLVTNTERVMAPSTGYYHVRVTVVSTANTVWQIRKNGTALTIEPGTAAAAHELVNTAPGTVSGTNGTVYLGVMSLAANDYLDIYNNSGSSFTFQGSSIEMVQLA